MSKLFASLITALLVDQEKIGFLPLPTSFLNINPHHENHPRSHDLLPNRRGNHSACHQIEAFASCFSPLFLMNHDNNALNLLTEGGATPENALFILEDLKHVINYTEDHLGEQEMVNELTKHWQRNQTTDNHYGFPNWEQYQSLLNHLGIDLEHMQQQLNDNFKHDDH